MPSSCQQHRRQNAAPRCIQLLARHQRHCQRACASACRPHTSFITCVHTQQAATLPDKILSTFRTWTHLFQAAPVSVGPPQHLNSFSHTHSQQASPARCPAEGLEQAAAWPRACFGAASSHHRYRKGSARCGPHAARACWVPACTASPGHTSAGLQQNMPAECAAAAHAYCWTRLNLLQATRAA